MVYEHDTNEFRTASHLTGYFPKGDTAPPGQCALDGGFVIDFLEGLLIIDVLIDSVSTEVDV